MECTFLNAAGVTLFCRNDMLSGHWIQQEMNINCEFPYKADKVIQIGQRMAFRDPATDVLEVFEIVNVRNSEPTHSQMVTADHICIAELSDEHINTTEITNKTASEALSTALTGTLWSVGTNTASGAQNGNFSRGSAWDAVCEIQKTWNVYITPRVVISSGAIVGRYLDIAPAEGVWRGLRLSVRKNMIDPVVTYDDTEVYTALYGYGGNVDKPQQSGDDKTEELTFADQVWTATSEHPAKPAGQTYLEWPEKTALYGRNGRPRYGYYQNGSIKDAATLLQKTWESLKQASEPKITVSGTCVDLYRLGYGGEPIRLHDIALVEIEETGELLHKQIVCNDVDLVNPDNTRPEIGDYIPNIIYINRDANRRGGGGGGSHGQTNEEDDEDRYYTEFFNLGTKIGMIVRTKNGVDYIDAPQISLAINDWDDPTSRILLKADAIDVDGLITALEAKTLGVGGLTVEGRSTFKQGADFEAGLATDSNAPINCGGVVNADSGFTVGGISGDKATWQTETIPTLSFSNRYNFVYRSNGTDYTALGYLVGSHGTKTIHYLGSATT